jgi:hypothetical protein
LRAQRAALPSSPAGRAAAPRKSPIALRAIAPFCKGGYAWALPFNPEILPAAAPALRSTGLPHQLTAPAFLPPFEEGDRGDLRAQRAAFASGLSAARLRRANPHRASRDRPLLQRGYAWPLPSKPEILPPRRLLYAAPDCRVS